MATAANTHVFTTAELAKCRALLAEESAKLVSKESGTWRKAVTASGTTTRWEDKAYVRMVRKWERISDGDRWICEEYLRRYASAGNTVEGLEVTDPKADRETFKGTWKMVRTALSVLRTDPAGQGVFQTLVWPAEFDGEFGEFCAESSPLHHEDARVFANAAEVPTAAHRNAQGHIYRVNAAVNPEDGTWNGQEVDDQARTPPLFGTWSRSAERWTLRIRGEHQTAPLFQTASRTTTGDILAMAAGIGAAFPGEQPLTSNPILVGNVDMDSYGMFSVSVEISFPIPQLLAVSHAHRRYIDIDVAFENQEAVPTLDDAVDEGHSPSNAWVVGFEQVAAFSARLNEFGLMNGSMTWRLPRAEAFGWCKVNNDAENPAWRYWAWNQVGDWQPVSGGGGGAAAATGTVLVKSSPAGIGAFFTLSKQNVGTWTFPCGTQVEVPAGTYSLSYTAPDGYAASSGNAASVTVGEGGSATVTAGFNAIEGGIADPYEIVPVYIDTANGGWLEDGDLSNADPNDSVYCVTGKLIDSSGNESTVTGKYYLYDGDITEIDVVEASYLDTDNAAYSTDPDYEEGDPLTPCESDKWYTSPNYDYMYFDGEEFFGHGGSDNVVYFDVENGKTGIKSNENRFTANTYYFTDDGITVTNYHWTGTALEVVSPRVPQGGSGDPIPVTAAAVGRTTVTRVGASDAEAAVPGLLYALASGADAGKLRALSAVTGLMAECTATAAPESAGGGFIDGGAVPSPQSSIFGTTSGGIKHVTGISDPTVTPTDKYILTTEFHFEFNEFGLVDVTATVQGEANPYYGTGGSGVTYTSGKSRERDIFVNNASGLHGTTGYYQGIRDETTTTLRAFKTFAEARSAANSAVPQNLSSNKAVENSISRHGKWWVLTTTETTRHAGS